MQNNKEGLSQKEIERNRTGETMKDLVSKKTLNRLVLYNEAIVRPFKTVENIQIADAYIGEIVKLPVDMVSNYDDTEAWKALIPKENNFKLGDKVLYRNKVSITLDSEELHLVSYFLGKIIN